MKSWICRPLHLGIISVGALLGSGGDAGGLHLGGADHHGAAAPGAGKTTLEQRVSKYIVSTVRFVLWVVTVLIVAQQLGIPVTSLVALFSVISLAVSLAVQNVLANVAGGLVLLVTKPFTVGITSIPPSGRNGAGDEPDLYLSGDHGGPAAGSSQQHPVLREDHQLLHAGHPAAPAQDHGLLRRCHGGRAKGLPDGGGADGQRAGRSCAGGVRQRHGESSIEYIVRCWTKTEDYWPAYYQLLEEIRNAFNEAGVEMCYNHLNVHIIEKKEETE